MAARPWATDVAALLALVVAAALVATLYVSGERTVHFWDFAAYHDMTLAKTAELRALFADVSPRGLPHAVRVALSGARASTGRDYSDLHVLPLVPVVLAFGASRSAYVIGLVLLYTLPFALAVGAVTTQLVRARARLAFWGGTVVTLLLPATWLPALSGYPDAGAAALVVLAVYLLLRDVAPEVSPRWWRPLAAGTCLALAVLFRRHFAYDAVALLGAAALVALADAGRAGRAAAAARSLRRSAARLGATGVAALAVLWVVGAPFVRRAATTNFGALYASYEVPALRNLVYYREYYGWAAVIIAAAGFVAAARTRVLARRPATLVIAFGLWAAAQWVLVVGQLGVHYTLHFTPLIALGLIAAGAAAHATPRRRARVMALAAGAAFLVVNAVVSLAPLAPATPASNGLLAARHPPPRRADYEQLVRLVGYLRAVAGPTDPVHVAASSEAISDDLLWHVNRALYEPNVAASAGAFWDGRALNIRNWAPFADSRDPYPLERLLEARLVVVATPVQYHLRPEEQDVVRVAVAAFTEGWELSRDFELLSAAFTLDGGAHVRVYRRLRPTPLATAVRTLEQMRRSIGPRPGGQLDWLGITTRPGLSLTRDGDSSYLAQAETPAPAPAAANAPAIALLHLGPMPPRARVTGRVEASAPGCAPRSLSLLALSAGGVSLGERRAALDPSAAPTFDLAVPGDGAAYLALETSPTPAAAPGCWVTVRGLRVVGGR